METGTARIYKRIAKVIEQDDDAHCTVYKVNSQKGYGKMTVFEVFPGVQLNYDEFDMINCFCDDQKDNDVIEINYCEEGRSEGKLKNGSRVYVGEGDLSVNVLSNHAIKIGFPLGHYKGIDVILYVDEFSSMIPKILHDVPIDIRAFREKICQNNECFIMRAGDKRDKIERIFLDLYNVPEAIQIPYFKVKLLELLLYLNVLNVSENREQRKYYPRQQVEIIKQIHDKITEHPEHRYTIENLSQEFGISMTALKSCFKGVYGTPIGAYMKVFRMQCAASLLRQTDRSVLNIASAVGYGNQGKFAASFKEVMGENPLRYRIK